MPCCSNQQMFAQMMQASIDLEIHHRAHSSYYRGLALKKKKSRTGVRSVRKPLCAKAPSRTSADAPRQIQRVGLCADSTLPAAERRNYKGVGDAFVRIVGEDGVGGLFRGAGPTIVRAMALNMGMFASNEQAKELLKEHTSLTGLPMCALPICDCPWSLL